MRVPNLTMALLLFTLGCDEGSSSATETKADSSSEKAAAEAAEFCHQMLSGAQSEPDLPLMSEEACVEKMLLIHAELSRTDWKDFQDAIQHINPTALEDMLDTTLEMAQSGEMEG